jgi:hypothetical protein
MIQWENERTADSDRGCNTSMKFSFTVGALAIVAAIALGYLALRWLK